MVIYFPLLYATNLWKESSEIKKQDEEALLSGTLRLGSRLDISWTFLGIQGSPPMEYNFPTFPLSQQPEMPPGNCIPGTPFALGTQKTGLNPNSCH